MRYYCKHCGTEYVVSEKTQKMLFGGDKELAENIGFKCGVCQDIPNTISYEMNGIPDYETVAQWEARTGRKYNDEGVVCIIRMNL